MYNEDLRANSDGVWSTRPGRGSHLPTSQPASDQPANIVSMGKMTPTVLCLLGHSGRSKVPRWPGLMLGRPCIGHLSDSFFQMCMP